MKYAAILTAFLFLPTSAVLACDDRCPERPHDHEGKKAQEKKERHEQEKKERHEQEKKERHEQEKKERHEAQERRSTLADCFDANDDGALSPAEANALRDFVRERCDRDGDGDLDGEERARFKRLLREAAAEHAAAAERRLLARFDDNDDGQLSPRERRAMARARREAAQARASRQERALLEEYDRDGDGRLDREEVAYARHHEARRRAHEAREQAKRLLNERR